MRWPTPLVARVQRCQNRDDCVQAGRDVNDCDANLHRVSVNLAGDGHDPGLALHNEVVARAVGPTVPADRSH